MATGENTLQSGTSTSPGGAFTANALVVVVTDPAGIRPNAAFAAKLIGEYPWVTFEFFTSSGEPKRFTRRDLITLGGEEALANAIRAEAPDKQ
jgi:hypothetical protein